MTIFNYCHLEVEIRSPRPRIVCRDAFITNVHTKLSKTAFTMVLLKGWKYAAFVGTIVGAIGLAIYPIIVSPMVNPEPYSKTTTTNRNFICELALIKLIPFSAGKQQVSNRRGIKQEEIQPGSK